jgi:DNA polymerase elongation subunit (family B)
MSSTCKLYDFTIYDEKLPEAYDENSGKKIWGDNKEFKVRMFGMNENGETYSIIVENFKPYFYVKVPNNWKIADKEKFIWDLKNDKIGGANLSYWKNSIVGCKIVKRRNLYGFDTGKMHKYIILKFKNNTAFNKARSLWYTNEENYRDRKLKKGGFEYKGHNLILYEAALPPLLRLFHITEISPSGWVKLKKFEIIQMKETSCTYEFRTDYKDIVSLSDKEDPIPLKVMSWDIEASSSHGDFPLAIKTYKKMLTEIVQYWTRNKNEIKRLTINDQKNIFKRLVFTAFRYDNIDEKISKIYLKNTKYKPTKSELNINLDKLLSHTVGKLAFNRRLFMKKKEDSDSETEREENKYNWRERYPKIPVACKNRDLIFCLNYKVDNTEKILVMETIFNNNTGYGKWFPSVMGDTTTFIGSTFQKIGEQDQYLNHMVSVGECSDIPEVPNRKIDCYPSEKKLLKGWVKLIIDEDPDIIIGYNTFGFDWKFLLDRAKELNCYNDFLKLSKLKDKKCRVRDTNVTVASGTYELKYVKIDGRVQLDLYNYFRKSVNLNSYKLDNVAAVFIGDIVNTYSYNEKENHTLIKSKNLFGLKNGHYISFELIGHSSDMYNEGEKFSIFDLGKDEFKVKGKLDIQQTNIKLRWCLNKDDITLEEMFNANTPDKRAKVAKYCFQDCNLVHNLMNKNDIWTEMSELAALCNIPIDFAIIRGQGIRLLSYIAKECRKNKTVMPVMEKDENDKGGYEGAVCLPPKCGFYAEDPVAVNDYSSLYPSCMISENISHDSKVWSKEYDLTGKLLPKKTIGERDMSGGFIYDDLPEYSYVNITYDTFEYRRLKGPTSAEEKVKTGHKVCRFAQFPDGKKAILPAVLSELLQSRKDTKNLMKKTSDPFMKNVYDKRQASKKVVANSLYGQCGSKTSSFYEKDIAASTTAVGRKMLFYAKRVVEDCYKNRTVDTKYGKMKTKAECIYGDSVTPDTPLLLKNKKTGLIEFKQIDDLSNNEWKPYEGFKVMESNRREKQQNIVDNYQIYTSKGWSNIKRVIRHKTIKNIYRVTTHTGMVDVTEDHSLLDENNKIVKPTQVKVGMKLLHSYPQFEKKEIKLKDILNYIKNIGKMSLCEKKAFILGFFYGDGSCGKYNCPSGVKYTWALNQKSMETCVILQSLLIEIYNESFKINDTIKSSGVYKIVPNCGNIKKYVEMYRSICYNKDKYKIIPVDILNGKYDIRYAYFAGYFAADGSKCPGEKAKTIRMSNKGKIGSAMLYYLASSIGFNVSVNTRKDKLNITRLTCTSGKQRKAENVIKKVDLICENVNDFVYDIETETGNFNTGYALIVKNTDSIFFKFNLKDMSGNKVIGKKALEVTIDLSVEVEKMASDFLKPPHYLEYEKTFMPFLLLSKKRYVGMLYEHDINKCKRKEMGIVLKRRDNAPCVKDCYGGIVDILMKKNDVMESVRFLKNYLNDMVNEKIKLNKLIISKSLKALTAYKNPDQIAHSVLAQRMGKRDPGTKPSTGSRVPFIYIETKEKKALQGDRIEHPDYVIKNKLKPDYIHYITNQIMKPVQQIYGLLLDQLPEFKSNVSCHKRIINNIKRKYKNDGKKMREKIEKECNKHVKLILFNDSLRLARNKKNNQKTLMNMWTK